MNTDHYFQVMIDLPQAVAPLEEDFYAQMMGYFFFQNSASGVEQRDDETFMEWGDITFPEKGMIRLVATFDKDFKPDSFLPELKIKLGELLPNIVDDNHKIVCTEITEDRWQYRWKTFFKPIVITPRIVVKPQWEPFTPAKDQLVMNIDPDMAFGTGQHETTALALGLIEEIITGDTPPKRMIDVGAGTAILSVGAALLDPKLIIDAIDIDKKTLGIARENVIVNHVGKTVSVREENVEDVTGVYDLVVANIISSILMMIRSDLIRLVKPGGILVLSGVQAHEMAQFKEKFNQSRFTLLQEQTRGDWGAFVFQRGDS